MMGPLAQFPEGADAGRPRVSLIIPSYNYAAFLAEAVESCLEQTAAGCEVLVVDDGSSDGSVELVRSRFGGRVRLVEKANGGLSSARNCGLREALADWVVFIDADDALMAHMVERMFRALATLEESRVGVIGCGAVAFGTVAPAQDFPSAVGREYDPAVCRRSVEDLILMTPFTPMVLGRREAFLAAGGFDETLPSSEDRDMWIRLAAQWEIWELKENLVLKREHGSNMSQHAQRQSASMRRVLQKAYRSGAVSGWRLWYWAQVWAIYLYQVALMWGDAGSSARSLVRLGCSLAVCPWITRPTRYSNVPFFRIRQLIRQSLRLLHPRDEGGWVGTSSRAWRAP